MAITLILTLTTIFLFLGYPAFEVMLATILLTPVLAFLFASPETITPTNYLISISLISGLFILLKIDSLKNLHKPKILEVVPFVVFTLAFLVLRWYCLQWPDFIALGERLRDFAILSSVIQSPVNLQEPWMAGFPLNYYAYWYRFGHMVSASLNLTTSETYHTLQSITFALFLTCSFRIFTKYLKFSFIEGLFFSCIISFGSNISGIINFITRDSNWWGPSRVITGAINEFPSWSFLLGDLHPHYLNLVMVPAFLCCLLSTLPVLQKPSQFLIAFLGAFMTCSLLIYNANAWEVPVWGALLLGIIFSLSLSLLAETNLKKRIVKFFESEGFDWKTTVFFVFMMFITYSLVQLQKNIVPASFPIDFVLAPIERTPLVELGQHFGLPIFLIAISFLVQLPDRSTRAFGALCLLSTLFFKQALPLLIILETTSIYRFTLRLGIIGKSRTIMDINSIVIEGFGIASIGLVIVPEIIFLNDPYGADIERMNTIFKIYSAAWLPLHLYAFYLFQSLDLRLALSLQKFRNLKSPLQYIKFSLLYILPATTALILFTGFFYFVSSGIRPIKDQSVSPKSDGLSEINRRFPGVAQTIHSFRELPKGITLEAQGNPYDYTSHVATLSENLSYLGWANHVNLLLSNNPEIGRREKVTEQFYKEKSCSLKSEILRNEKIKYVVYGPLERQRYSDSSMEDFNCLKKTIDQGSYQIYQIQ